MPAFTHLLGPVVDGGAGKPQTRLQRRLSITRSLIDQLPRHSHFYQHLDPSLDGGLAIADGLAFQERRFEVAPQYTFEVDCRKDVNDLFAALYLKTRQHIRRAEKEYSIRTLDNPKVFVDFYLNNIKESGRVNRIEFAHFSTLFAESRARESGEIIGAFDSAGAPVAMTYLVWGHGIMYYLLSTRSVRAVDYGSGSLLLWIAMKRANEIGLLLDLDGIYSAGTARFLTNFGGEIKTRLTIRRSRMPFSALQYLKRQISPDDSRFFT
jgi:lipid II:glycine glycyltransferase (peptidoglycan interpeptide bridge formation enzyme)